MACGFRSTSPPPRAPPSAAWSATIPAARARCATATPARTCFRSMRCCRTAARCISARSRPTSPTSGGLRPLAKRPHGDRRARSGDGQGALPAGATPGRRLQSRRARARQERRQPRAYPGRLRRHARLLDQDRAQALAAARPPRGRRLPLRQFPERDGGGAAHRQARADCGRTDRPHHARPRARHRDVPADHQCGGARRSRGDPVRRVRRGRPPREFPPAAAALAS